MTNENTVLDNKRNNIRQLRRILNMTQKDFIAHYITDYKGNPAISSATLSNLESRGGSRLDEVIDSVCQKINLDREAFTLDSSGFNEKCLQVLKDPGETSNVEIGEDKSGKITNLLNRLTMYFADEMIEGRLKRGDQIESDRELAQKMGVGRSTVREALKVLDVLGMIDIRLGQGTYLANRETNCFSIPLSWSLFLDGGQIDNILVIRSILEVKAAELAANCPDEALLDKLHDVYYRMHQNFENKDYQKFLDDDIEFHSCIALCSENPIIYSMLQTIRNLLRRISGTGLVDEKQFYDIYDEHRRIFGAIICHNSVLAAKYMQEHVEQAGTRYDYGG